MVSESCPSACSSETATLHQRLAEIREVAQSHFRGVKENFERVFVLGEVDAQSRDEALSTSLHGIDKQRLLKFFVDQLYLHTPQQVRDALRQDPFIFAPLPKTRVSEYIGGGYTNSVYRSSASVENLALLVHRPRFKTEKEAFDRAQILKHDRDFYAELYKDIPDFVPAEDYVVYTAYNGRPNVLCIKDYITEEITDLWDLEANRLQDFCKASPLFARQLTAFVKISLDNIQTLQQNGLDVTGSCNIAVVGTNENTRLVLLDPHNANRPETVRGFIQEGLQYLAVIVEATEQ